MLRWCVFWEWIALRETLDGLVNINIKTIESYSSLILNFRIFQTGKSSRSVKAKGSKNNIKIGLAADYHNLKAVK